jgi:lipoyl(octanoyl) transferase
MYAENEANESGVQEGPGLSSRIVCLADYLGTMAYDRALKLQETLMLARARRAVTDVLLLLQHPHVFTVGRFRGETDITVPAEILNREGIAVLHTNRGGGITYHGPGQLVGYPIISLKERSLGVREYISKLEATIIRLLSDFGIRAYRDTDYPGVWVDGEKICSVGIRVSRGVTAHGFALNVNTDLRHFEYINPCGLSDKVMTSISKVLGYRVEVEAVIKPLLDSFSTTFGLQIEREHKKCLAIIDGLSG